MFKARVVSCRKCSFWVKAPTRNKEGSNLKQGRMLILWFCQPFGDLLCCSHTISGPFRDDVSFLWDFVSKSLKVLAQPPLFFTIVGIWWLKSLHRGKNIMTHPQGSANKLYRRVRKTKQIGLVTLLVGWGVIFSFCHSFSFFLGYTFVPEEFGGSSGGGLRDDSRNASGELFAFHSCVPFPNQQLSALGQVHEISWVDLRWPQDISTISIQEYLRKRGEVNRTPPSHSASHKSATWPLAKQLAAHPESGRTSCAPWGLWRLHHFATLSRRIYWSGGNLGRFVWKLREGLGRDLPGLDIVL